MDITENMNINGWEIDKKRLWTSEMASNYVKDLLFESPDQNFACLFYNIDEYRMGFYGGLIAIYEGKNRPLLTANPKNQWFDYYGDRSVSFSDKYLFARKLAYNENEGLSGTPFVVFDLEKRKFAFIDFDVTSIYYSLAKDQNCLYRFILDYPNELKNMRVKFPSRHGQTVNLGTLNFYPLDNGDDMIQMYFQEKSKEL